MKYTAIWTKKIEWKYLGNKGPEITPRISLKKVFFYSHFLYKCMRYLNLLKLLSSSINMNLCILHTMTIISSLIYSLKSLFLWKKLNVNVIYQFIIFNKFIKSNYHVQVLFIIRKQWHWKFNDETSLPCTVQLILVPRFFDILNYSSQHFPVSCSILVSIF